MVFAEKLGRPTGVRTRDQRIKRPDYDSAQVREQKQDCSYGTEACGTQAGRSHRSPAFVASFASTSTTDARTCVSAPPPRSGNSPARRAMLVARFWRQVDRNGRVMARVERLARGGE